MKQYIGVKALIRHDGRYLFMRRSSKYGEIEGLWDIPGGRIEPGEEPEDGLRREVKEETGIELERIEQILDASTVFRDDESHIVRITYLCKASSADAEVSHEHTELAWLSLDEIGFRFKDRLIQKCVDSIKGLPKLVRDRIPDLIRREGRRPATRVADDEEYWMMLQKKLYEECKEFLCTPVGEELADLLEVCDAIASFKKWDVPAKRLNKLKHKGGFSKRFILEK